MAEMKEVTVPVRVDFTSNVLSGEQLARVAALKAARVSLVSSGPLSSGAADPFDLVNVARYIETGEDPYAVAPAAPAEPKVEVA